MPAKNGFQLQDRDIELLNYTFHLRVATIDHLGSLSGRSVRALWNRLAKLKKRRYLTAVARFMQKWVYGLGPEGLPALAEHGFAPQELIDKRLRHRELTDMGIRHALLIADIHARLLKLAALGQLRLLHWQEGPALWDQVTAANGSAIPIRPDAWMTLAPVRAASSDRLHIFLEADRGTMAHSRMAQKIEGYLTYHGQQRFTARYPGMKTFSVLTVTESRRRARELQDALHPLLPNAKSRRAYPFVPIEDLTPEALGVKPTALP